jgi:hypothetical protein
MNNDRVILGSLVLILMVASPAFAVSENRFESWQQLSVSQNLGYNLTASVEVENRQAFQSPSWVHTEIDPQLNWRYSPRYDFGAGLEWSATQYPGMSEITGYQPFLETRIKWRGGRWDVSSRQRFQTGGDSEGFVAMFRQLTRAQYRLQGFGDRLSLYAADEWFLNLLQGQIQENRAELGTSYALNTHMNLEVYGMLQNLWNVNGLSGTIPVIGFKAILAF